MPQFHRVLVCLALLASLGLAASTDAKLEKDIQARFARSKIAVNHFQVRVRDSVATIDGRTSVPQHKGTATRLARHAGALKVVNRVQIVSTQPRPRAHVKR